MGCWTAHIRVRSGSNSAQADHSAWTTPAEPPDIASASSHSGGNGTSSVGVALFGHDIGTPTEPSA